MPLSGAPTIARRRSLLLVLPALAVVWVAGGLWALRQLESRRETHIAEAVEGLRTLVDGTQRDLDREARILAADPAVVEGVRKGDWATLARGVSPRLISVSVERVADLVLIVDARGSTLVQVPALPRLPAVELTGAAASPFRVLNDQAYILGTASVAADTVGVVLVGRRFDRVDRGRGRGTQRPALVAAEPTVC